ncbi:MAG: hypothetical protein KKA81_13320 [Bacteroidetes bacterium]|nr:hypothetical protein [Bacteroidota bacterium]
MTRKFLFLIMMVTPFSSLQAGTGHPGDESLFFLTVILCLIIVLGIVVFIEEFATIRKNIKELLHL